MMNFIHQADVHKNRMSIFKFLRDAQYGLRGVRVGEAINPGPHNLVFRRIRRPAMPAQSHLLWWTSPARK